MDHDKHPVSIWDLDPQDLDLPSVEEFERLFMEAYSYTFRVLATPQRVRPYLRRYLRFRVVPPWVRRYVREVLAGDAIGNLGDAPLDPAVDWSFVGRYLSYALPLLSAVCVVQRVNGDDYLEA